MTGEAMNEPSIDISGLRWHLDTSYSRVSWHERGDGTIDVRVDYVENGPVFAIDFLGVTENNLEVATFIAHGIGGAAEAMYRSSEEDNAAHPDPGVTYIVGTRAFGGALQVVIDRHASVAHSHGLKVEMRDTYAS
jgi:hypothetical protein